jgi:hypothetical protein
MKKQDQCFRSNLYASCKNSAEEFKETNWKINVFIIYLNMRNISAWIIGEKRRKSFVSKRGK